MIENQYYWLWTWNMFNLEHAEEGFVIMCASIWHCQGEICLSPGGRVTDRVGQTWTSFSIPMLISHRSFSKSLSLPQTLICHCKMGINHLPLRLAASDIYVMCLARANASTWCQWWCHKLAWRGSPIASHNLPSCPCYLILENWHFPYHM